MELIRWVKCQWDRFGAIVASLGGAVCLLVGWIGVSGATLTTQQIPYLASGGLFGIFLLGVAATLWLSADLRDEWRKLNDIHTDLQSWHANEAYPPAAQEPLTQQSQNGAVAPPKARRSRVGVSR